jgi:hypothetical protein
MNSPGNLNFQLFFTPFAFNEAAGRREGRVDHPSSGSWERWDRALNALVFEVREGEERGLRGGFVLRREAALVCDRGSFCRLMVVVKVKRKLALDRVIEVASDGEEKVKKTEMYE